jgi:hypothetical protein
MPVYYLNNSSFVDRQRMMDEFLTNLGFNFERIESNSQHNLRQTRINEGFIKLVHRAIENNIYPFLILEDDARLIKDLPAIISIPEEIKLIYWGCSLYECGGAKPKLAISEYNDNYYRLHNSLACHAIVIPHRIGAEYFIKINQEAIEQSQYSDVLFAVNSKNEIYLTPKDGPYVYQNDAHTEPITKFLWEDIKPEYLA